MVWIIFFMISCLAALVFVPLSSWKKLWPSGILTILLIYMIDNTFIHLGAFSYTAQYSAPPGIPIFYILSGIFGGIILAHFNPAEKKWRLLYVLLTSAVFLAMELIMHWMGYFHYNNWNPVNSYFLDIIGINTMLTISSRLEYIHTDV